MSVYKKYCKEEFDEKGNIKNFAIQFKPDFNFAYDVIDYLGENEPDRTAVVWCNPEGEEKIISFKDLQILSNKAANVFKSYGIRKGDKVMTVLKRHYEYWYVVMALHKIGAVMVPVTHMLTVEDLSYRVDGAEIKAAVISPYDDVPEKLLDTKHCCEALKYIFSVRKDVEGCINFTEEVENASEEFERIPMLATDPLALYFTSGTTGYPKGVIHDHTYPLAHIVTAKYWQKAEDGGLHFTVAETGWAKTSWGKMYGQWLVGSAVMVYDFDNFDPKQLANIINKYKVTTFCAPPTIYRYMVRKNISDLHTLKNAVTAGEALSPEVFKAFHELTGLTLMEGFGQTETTLLLANFACDASKNGSMGTPSPMYNVKIVREDGSETDVGEIGEIVVFPPENEKQIGVFSGYHDNDALYEYVWRSGYYHTGDSACRDEDGYFWFKGRIDDVIKTGGYRVGPFEIESILDKHPAVVECSVFGIPDELRGQAIKAAVVLSPDYKSSQILQKEIKDFCNIRLAEYKWVRVIEFVSELPKTISGKIKKGEIK